MELRTVYFPQNCKLIVIIIKLYTSVYIKFLTDSYHHLAIFIYFSREIDPFCKSILLYLFDGYESASWHKCPLEEETPR